MAFHDVDVVNPNTNNTITFTVPKRYKNLQFINDGAQGAVVSAHDSHTGADVAIKKLSDVIVGAKKIQRAIREFVLLTSVKHPNIIRTYSVFTPQQTEAEFKDVYLVMELMKHDFSKVSKLKLDHKNLSFFIYQILCAVNHLHREGILHRDLKPCNVAVNERAEVKVLDFGLARLFNTTEGMTSYVVTRYYRAPEVVCGQPYTEKVDVWSIGCILAEMITGQVLFPGRDRNNQWDKIVDKLGSPTPEFIAQLDGAIAEHVRGLPPVLPKPLEQIIPDEHFPENGENPHWTASGARRFIAKMLAFDPNERYSTEEALNDPYVRKWYREPEVHAPLSNNDHAINRNFLNAQRPALDDMKELIFEEVKRIEAIHDIFTGRL